MECACICNFYDDGVSQFYKSKTVKAGKHHKCCECRCIIKPGEQYEYTKGLFENRWFRAKTCLVCMKIRDDFCCHGHYHGELWTTVQQKLSLDEDMLPDTYWNPPTLPRQ